MTTQTIKSTLAVTELTKIIAKVTQAERITKEGLSILSRELLAHAYEFGDISLINDLMGVDPATKKFRLTPINWRIAAQYFNHFVAFTSNFEKDIQKYAIKGEGNRVALTFNKKSKQKFLVKEPAVQAWLSDPANDLWSWSNDIEMEVKAPDYLKNIANDINKALDEEKGGLDAMTVLMAIVDNTEIDLSTLRAFIERPVEVAGDALAGEVSA